MDDETYDVVVCGTSLNQCVLSGLLSQEGKKVLHIDRNSYYGGEGASINMTNLWKIFKQHQQVPAQFGHNRDWNIDLIPKYIMHGGQLVKILLKTRVSKYLQWKSIDGTYVAQSNYGGLFHSEGLKIHKVPVSPSEALSSSLLGLFQKRKCQKFFEFVQGYEKDEPYTHQQIKINNTTKQMFQRFNLEQNTIDFIGHAIALYTNQDFLHLPAKQFIRKCQLYMDSIGNNPSPFIYPIFGLGGIPQGFSRISAVNGGTFMLNTDIDEILFDEDGMLKGVRGPEGTAFCRTLICNPSYAIKCGLKDRVQFVEKIIRCICILDHPIPNTQNATSIQIILPQKQLQRKNNIYVMMVSSQHFICKKGYYIAIISTTVQTSNPQKQIDPAFEIIGTVKEKFTTISERYVSSNESKDGIYICDSFDATSHFENQVDNVLELYQEICGKELDLVPFPEEQEE